MNILIILGIVILLYFLYKVHTSAAKFDDSLHLLNADENEYFIESEINRVVHNTAYLETYGCLPEGTKTVFVSITAKTIIYKGAVNKMREKALELAKTENVEIDQMHIITTIGKAVDRAMNRMYK